MDERRDRLRQKQRDAIWKWRWLGLRESTPGFKGAMVVVVVAIVFIALHAFAVL
jgi:hypothetical protein